MHVQRGSLIASTFISFFIFCMTIGYADTSDEKSELRYPKYTDVDVRIEYISQVKVFEKKENDKSYLIILLDSGTREEILLFKGVIVCVFDHNTKKLLKTYDGDN